LVLTGTPIENSLTDLWSQMNFLNPGILGSLDFFKDSFVTPIEKAGDSNKEEMLGKLIEPFILRRTKEIVAKDLPALSEKIHYCEMTEEQEKLYEERKSAVRNFIIKNISTYGRNKSRFIILKGLMQLRLISNHPRLFNKTSDADSGKFNEVIRSIESLLSENHKVLVFSQFVKHIKLFEEYLQEKNILYCKITGGIPDKQRKEMVTAFQKEANKKLFLISLKAGGVGLNLTAADYVFLLDPWWNPAVEYQAINRAHRIGQVKNVFAYKFITKNSIEEKIYHLQQKKSALAEKFIHTNNPIQYFSNEEIYQFFN
jgi:SNF2 family DNA or RNA helicase